MNNNNVDMIQNNGNNNYKTNYKINYWIVRIDEIKKEN